MSSFSSIMNYNSISIISTFFLYCYSQFYPFLPTHVHIPLLEIFFIIISVLYTNSFLLFFLFHFPPSFVFEIFILFSFLNVFLLNQTYFPYLKSLSLTISLCFSLSLSFLSPLISLLSSPHFYTSNQFYQSCIFKQKSVKL